jgi:hypothetical protein
MPSEGAGSPLVVERWRSGPLALLGVTPHPSYFLPLTSHLSLLTSYF